MTQKRSQIAVDSKLLEQMKEKFKMPTSFMFNSLMEKVLQIWSFYNWEWSFSSWVDARAQCSSLPSTKEDEWIDEKEEGKEKREEKGEYIIKERFEGYYVYDGISCYKLSDEDLARKIWWYKDFDPADDDSYERVMRLKYGKDWDIWDEIITPAEDYPCVYNFAVIKKYVKTMEKIDELVFSFQEKRQEILDSKK